MFADNQLRSAVRLSLGLGAGAFAVGFAPGAMAQDQASADEPLEEIITTGSRIKRADLDSASPVTVLKRDDILASGITDVGNIVQKMPSMSGSPIGTTTNNGGNGSVLVDLRGMGVNRTVTLVNGRRVVDGGDYQTIPSTMIERVEILKDGASAVYGADAVAGVVNIITRKDFEGLELGVQGADWFDMDSGAQVAANFIAGTTFAGGNIVFGAEFIDQEEAYQSDAPWDFFQDSYYIYPEGCENTLTQPYPTGCYPLGSSRIPESRLAFVNQGTFHIGTPATQPYQAGLMTEYDGRLYNYAPVNFIQTPYTRTNVFAETNFELSDTVMFHGELRGNFRESKQELAPQPYNSPTDPAYDGVFNGTAYSGISEDNYYLRQAVDAYNAATGAGLVYEPVRDFRRRMIETSRSFTQEITQYQFVAALEGVLMDELDWEISWNHGYRSRVDNDFGQFQGDLLSNALGPSADLDGDGLPECYSDVNDPSTLIAGCVPFNAFGGGAVDPVTSEPTVTTLTQDMIDYVQIDLVDTFVTTQDIWSASISGELFENLPAGGIGWAAGVGYWGQTYTYSADSNKQTDSVTGNTGVGTDGSLYNTNAFVEFLAPVWDNGTQAFDIKGGFRWDDYNAFDSDTTWQLGLEFQALDSLKLRATAGTVFRAPTITDLYGGVVDSFPTYTDPCDPTSGPIAPGCAQGNVPTDSQVLAKVGGNPNVLPETGDTLTAGIVWTPDFGAGDLSVTLDYWDIQLEDGISSLGVQFILEDCYERQNQSSCDLITRRPDYSIAQIVDGVLNVAEQGASGVDFEVRYGWSTGIGDFEAALLWAHLLERRKIPDPTSDEIDLSGRYTDPTAEDGGAYAQDKANLSLQWYWNNLSIGYLGEYISAIDADTFCNCDSDGDPSNNGPDGEYIQKIDSYWYHDIVASYEFAATGTRISAGVTNLTDEKPPYIEVGFNATTDPPTYRMFGMGYYLRLTQSFE
jgi:iron complex outermembrane receptor protein